MRTGGRLGEEGRGDEDLCPPAALLALTMLALLAATVQAEELRGHVHLLAKGGKSPDRGSDVRQAVVYFEAASPQPVRPAAEPFEMVTKRKELVPRVLVIPRGSRVRFPNQDPILHNVFSVSSPNQFDLGLYRAGPGKEKRFEAPGLVRVYCNVHHDMVAYILVLDTPYSASPDASGDFVLIGVPRGPGKLTVWHEQGEPWTARVELPQKTPLQIGLEIVRPLIPAHVNKQGQSYFRSQRDRYDNR
jgi:plastocyanin